MGSKAWGWVVEYGQQGMGLQAAEYGQQGMGLQAVEYGQQGMELGSRHGQAAT